MDTELEIQQLKDRVRHLELLLEAFAHKYVETTGQPVRIFLDTLDKLATKLGTPSE